MFKEAAAAADVWAKGLFISIFLDEDRNEECRTLEESRVSPKPWVNMQRRWLALQSLCINDDFQIWKLRMKIDAESIWWRASRKKAKWMKNVIIMHNDSSCYLSCD